MPITTEASTGSACRTELDLTVLLKDINIPPRPSSLVDLQQELEREEPRIDRLVNIVNSDVAMSAALLKLVNSPWLGLSGFFAVGLILSLLVFIGEGVRDAFDPRKTLA